MLSSVCEEEYVTPKQMDRCSERGKEQGEDILKRVP